jgi:hypothetical protein
VIPGVPCCLVLQGVEPLLKVVLPAIAIILEVSLSGTG